MYINNKPNKILIQLSAIQRNSPSWVVDLLHPLLDFASIKACSYQVGLQ